MRRRREGSGERAWSRRAVEETDDGGVMFRFGDEARDALEAEDDAALARATDEATPAEDTTGEERASAPPSEPAKAWEVRAATPADLDDVVAMAACSGVEWSGAQIADELRTPGNLLVAVPVRPGVLAAAAEPAPIVSGLVASWVVAGEVQILEVAVHPSVRRRGLGRALVRAALDRSPAGEAALEVRASNEAAIGLYRGMGFKEVGVRKGYYADGEDAVLMNYVPPTVRATSRCANRPRR